MQELSDKLSTKRSRAVRLDSFGGPEVLDIREVPAPQAGPGQVRVRVTAAGLNPMEVHGSIPQGIYPFPSLPCTTRIAWGPSESSVGEPRAASFVFGEQGFGQQRAHAKCAGLDGDHSSRNFVTWARSGHTVILYRFLPPGVNRSTTDRLMHNTSSCHSGGVESIAHPINFGPLESTVTT